MWILRGLVFFCVFFYFIFFLFFYKAPISCLHLNVWGKKGAFDMSAFLPLERWIKEKLAEREDYSDEKTSDEEDSDYEEIVIPSKRKLKLEKPRIDK